MIEISRLQKVIENNTVLDISNIQVSPGEIVSVVGPVGSGKKQLLDILIGKSLPTVGEIQIGHTTPIKHDEFSRLVGVLFLDDGLYTRQTVQQNLDFQARLYNINKKRVLEVLTQVGLGDHTGVRVEKISSGLSRRLALGRAILHKPKVLILVEPFERCDESSIQLLSRVFLEFAEDGVALLILAEDLNNLNTICDKVYLLNQGKIVEEYNPSEVHQASLPFKIPVRYEGRVTLVNPVDILFADAGEGRAYLQTREIRLPTQFNLSELEERLSRSGFFRAHRSYLVNLQHVMEVIPYTRNSYSLRLNDEKNTEIPLSKAAAGELRALLGF
jgi:ABC-2 type transport system ATP-binding protein